MPRGRVKNSTPVLSVSFSEFHECTRQNSIHFNWHFCLIEDRCIMSSGEQQPYWLRSRNDAQSLFCCCFSSTMWMTWIALFSSVPRRIHWANIIFDVAVACWCWRLKCMRRLKFDLWPLTQYCNTCVLIYKTIAMNIQKNIWGFDVKHFSQKFIHTSSHFVTHIHTNFLHSTYAL